MVMDKLREKMFGRPADGSVCLPCGSTKVKPEDFKSDLNRKEFSQSQMCQVCQDDFFVPRCEECGSKENVKDYLCDACGEGAAHEQ